MTNQVAPVVPVDPLVRCGHDFPVEFCPLCKDRIIHELEKRLAGYLDQYKLDQAKILSLQRRIEVLEMALEASRSGLDSSPSAG